MDNISVWYNFKSLRYASRWKPIIQYYLHCGNKCVVSLKPNGCILTAQSETTDAHRISCPALTACYHGFFPSFTAFPHKDQHVTGCFHKRVRNTVIRVITRYQIYDVEKAHIEVMLRCSSSLTQTTLKILWKRLEHNSLVSHLVLLSLGAVTSNLADILLVLAGLMRWCHNWTEQWCNVLKSPGWSDTLNTSLFGGEKCATQIGLRLLYWCSNANITFK